MNLERRNLEFERKEGRKKEKKRSRIYEFGRKKIIEISNLERRKEGDLEFGRKEGRKKGRKKSRIYEFGTIERRNEKISNLQI